jgi:hypothetical protein
MENSELTTGSASPLPLCLKLDADQVLFEPLGQVHAGIVWAMPSRMDQTLGRVLDHADHHAHHHEHRANRADGDGGAERKVQISRSVRLVNKPEM